MSGKKLANTKKRYDKFVGFWIPEKEYKQLLADHKASGIKTQSAYIRNVLSTSNKKPKKIFTPEILRHLGLIGIQIGRLENNINQFTRLAHGMNKKGLLNSEVFAIFNNQMAEYLKSRKELIKVFRSVMCSK